MAKEVTFRGKLAAKYNDCMGYITYVFEDLHPKDSDFIYIMCTQFPNWNQSYIEVGDIGFVTVRYVTAGIDKWFNGTSYVPYKNTDIHFLKFIPEPQNAKDVIIDLPNKTAEEFLEINLND